MTETKGSRDGNGTGKTRPERGGDVDEAVQVLREGIDPYTLREIGERLIENALDQLISERDAAEEAVGDLYHVVTGRDPQWSNNFGYGDAIREVKEALPAPSESEDGEVEPVAELRDGRGPLNSHETVQHQPAPSKGEEAEVESLTGLVIKGGDVVDPEERGDSALCLRISFPDSIKDCAVPGSKVEVVPVGTVQRLQRELDEAKRKVDLDQEMFSALRSELDQERINAANLRAERDAYEDPGNWVVEDNEGHPSINDLTPRYVGPTPSDSTEADEESYILEKISVGRTLRPSELFTIAREERAPFTETELRRKVWALVDRGVLELTDEMKLHHPPSPENEPTPSDSTEADEGESYEGEVFATDRGFHRVAVPQNWTPGSRVRITRLPDSPPESEEENDGE